MDAVKQQNKQVNQNYDAARTHADGEPNKPRAQPVKDTLDQDGVPKNVHLRDNATFDWESVGTFTSSKNADKKKQLETSKQIEDYVYNHLYGDWFWNCSLMLGTCLFSWAIARLGFGVFSLVIVLLFTNSVYRMEYRRFNRDIRDDMTRITANNRLDNEVESMEWLNSFLDKFWVIYMPAMTDMVIFQANEILKDQAPGFGIDALSLDEFTLGSKAPRINSVKSYPSKGYDHIEMDWDFSFAPNDTDDMTKREIQKMIKPKVALGVTVGKAFVSKTLPILVEDMSMTGRMNIKLKLTQNFPHVKMVSVQFLEAPNIDYALKPVGGDTFGLDIMSFIPGLSSFVNGIIHATLRPMLYAPNSLDIDVEDIMAQQSNDSFGVVAVTIKKCTKLKTGIDTKPNSINPYVQIEIANNPKIDERTKAKKEVNDPIYLETKYILVNQLTANHINLNVFDLIKDKADDNLIGSASFPMDELLQKEIHTGLVKNLTESGKTVGKIEFDVRYYPTIPPIVHEDGTKEAVTDTEIGILKINLHEAKDLDLSESVIGVLNPYAEIYVNNELAKECRKLRRTNEPSWEESFEALITEQSTTTVQVLVKDAVDDDVVAKFDANLQDIIFETSRGQQWLQAAPMNGVVPKIRISANWKALSLDEDLTATSYKPPIGGIRIHVRSAKKLKNLESVGTIDPYVRLTLNSKLRGRTQTIANTVDPYFNSVFFLPVGNEHQHYLLELMDEENEGKDRSLGTASINVFDYLKKNDEGYYLGYDGSEEIIEQPVLFHGAQEGTLLYSVSFVPTIPVLSLSQIKHKPQYLKELQEKEDRVAAQKERDQKLYDEHPDQYEWIDVEDNTDIVPEAIEMPLQKAVKYRAGAMAVHVNHGRFEKTDLFLHVLFDDHASPSGVSPKATGKVLATKTDAEGFIRDLPNSNIIFRLSKSAEIHLEKDLVLEKQYQTLDLLEKSNARPYTLKLGPGNTIEIQMEFIPTAAHLEPLDTILDVGKMKLEIIKAENLKAVDSNGKSDPLCSVKVDGFEVYKTDKKRKNLNPEWNEGCEIPFLSRSRQIVLVEVYDYDYTHDDRLIGRAQVDFSKMNALENTPFQVQLDTQGSVFLSAMFKPEYLRPKLVSRGGALSLGGIAGGAVGAVGAVGSAGVGAVGAVGHAGVGGATAAVDMAEHALSKGTGFLKKGFGRKKSMDPPREQESQNNDVTKEGEYDTKPKKNIEATEEEKEVAQEQERSSKGFLGLGKSKKDDDEQEEMQAQPNIVPENLPPPQFPGSPTSANGGSITGRPSIGSIRTGPRGHARTGSGVSDVASFTSTINGADSIPGRALIVEASGYDQSSLDVKVVLKTSTKEKELYKTRPTKNHGGIYKINESVAFRSNPEGELYFIVREHHSFGRSSEIATAVVPLETVLNRSENIAIQAGPGQVVVSIKYHSL